MTGPVHRDRLQCHAVAAALAFLLLVSATSAAADAADAAAKLGVAVQQALKGQDAGRVESYQGLPATLDSLNATSADAANMGSSNSTWRNAMYGNVTSVTPNSSASDREQTARERLRWGAELRSYLEAVFAGRPEYLQRIQKAWGIEQRDAFRLGNVFGYRLPDSQGSQNVQAMDTASLPPGNPAINALYEADHPWAESRMEELVTGRGYPLEKYPVVTVDGYELILYRIPYGKYRNNKPGKRPLVFLQHGVTLASDCYTILNANESVAYIMADAGFDVWMGNTRGNTYSRGNVNGIYPYQPEFWYFSIDQLALVDLPTTVDFALATSGASKLAYVGHSQGCTLVYALLAGRPEYNNKFSAIAHMGPVLFVDFFRAPFLRFAAINSLDVLLTNLGFQEFIPNRLTAPLIISLCPVFPIDELCAAAISFFTFGPSIFITPDDYITIATTWPSGVGIRNFNHWAQLFRSPEIEFRQFDFGTTCGRTVWRPGRGFIPRPFYETCNQEVYAGSLTPPLYDFSKVTAPMYMFLAENDVLSVATDVEEQVRRIGPAHRGDFIYSDYGHMDFVWDRNSKHTVDMVDLFFRYSPGTF